MKSSAKKIELASVDDLFSTEEGRQDAKLEKIQEIPLSELHPFRNHPFKVKDDEAMMETADSIKQYGVLVPAIARPDPEGGYELVAGHRRRRASELAEKETMPVIIRDLDDDAATIIMVDSNLQRESLLPSERAFAYKMKLEAVKHQGARTDLTSRQVGEKSQTSIQKVADQAGESQRQVQRYGWLRNTAAVTACSLSVPEARRKRSCPGRRYSAGLPSSFRRTGSIPKKNRTVLTTSTPSPSGKLWRKEGSSTARWQTRKNWTMPHLSNR